LLSQTLVAFTIEADYEFERQMPHITTEKRKAGEPVQGPWLISLPFWSVCLAHVAEEGTTIGEVVDRGFLEDNFLLGTNPGMVRWGYLRLEQGQSTSKRPNRSWLACLKPGGRRAKVLVKAECRWQSWSESSRRRTCSCPQTATRSGSPAGGFTTLSSPTAAGIPTVPDLRTAFRRTSMDKGAS
jgi:hypothetical protein